MDDPCGEWIEKAEEDFRAALALRRLRGRPAHNAVCFHAQQCIEKYLKAVLQQQGLAVRKTHALPSLLDQCAGSHPNLNVLRQEMVGLSTYAVEFRYPGESATIDEAKEAVRIMKNARLALKTALSKKISSSNHGMFKQPM